MLNQATERTMSYQHPHLSALTKDITRPGPGQPNPTSSPLLLKRLQQQKKKLAESSRRSLPVPVSSVERTAASHNPATVKDAKAPVKLTPPSIKTVSSGGRRGDINRRIEGMGARETDQVGLFSIFLQFVEDIL